MESAKALNQYFEAVNLGNVEQAFAVFDEGATVKVGQKMRGDLGTACRPSCVVLSRSLTARCSSRNCLDRSFRSG